ncbi:glycosyltransferase family 4 protein [Phaeocystidibacter marisrubri]|uniref:Glycosyltransferase family 4 protein n=2 Tax=Phaeocystidibacter marisrubri TaxID=1577780 RepID=A0A6L3ZHR9_9FLAO|nr:glycosyltransferase family 4 protein [Phaeocystidibacter marisrubri]
MFCVLCSMRIAIAVTNDLSTDQRVQRTIDTLQNLGFEVTFIGRKLPTSVPFNPNYKTIRFVLPFRTGAAFYASYNLRLFWHLLFNKYDMYLANDADTLLAIGTCASLKSVPFVYDSHEFFTGVPEIQDRPAVIKTWKWIEQKFYPKAKARITVNASIASLLVKAYGGESPAIVRNIGKRPERVVPTTREAIGIPESAFVVINQGAGINVDRGMEEALEAVASLSDVVLLIVGNGDAVPKLKEEVDKRGIREKVVFVGKVPYSELLGYTALANVGLSLDKPTSINYQFSLPNKLFDYLHTGIPVITSKVVEVKRIVDEYRVGITVDSSSPSAIAEAIEEMRNAGVEKYAEGIKRAQSELTWNQERKVLEEVFTPFLNVQK